MRFTIPVQISVFQCLLKTPSRPCQFQVYPRKLFWLRHTWHGCQNLGTAYEFSTRPAAPSWDVDHINSVAKVFLKSILNNGHSTVYFLYKEELGKEICGQPILSSFICTLLHVRLDHFQL